MRNCFLLIFIGMKLTIAMIFSLVFLLAFPGYGQGDGKGSGFDPSARAKENTEEMRERLALDDRQFKYVEKINLDAANKMKYTFDKAMGDREAMRAALLKVNEETNKKFKEVLSEQQWEAYLELVEERRKKLRQNPPSN